MPPAGLSITGTGHLTKTMQRIRGQHLNVNDNGPFTDLGNNKLYRIQGSTSINGCHLLDRIQGSTSI